MGPLLRPHTPDCSPHCLASGTHSAPKNDLAIGIGTICTGTTGDVRVYGLYLWTSTESCFSLREKTDHMLRGDNTRVTQALCLLEQAVPGAHIYSLLLLLSIPWVLG